MNVQMDGEKGNMGQEEATSPILCYTHRKKMPIGTEVQRARMVLRKITVEQSSVVLGR